MAKKGTEKNGGTERKRRRQSDQADWGAIDGGILGRVITAVTKTGGAIRMGYTRDGGAYSVGIYGDGEPFTEFCPATADVESWLEGIILDYE